MCAADAGSCMVAQWDMVAAAATSVDGEVTEAAAAAAADEAVEAVAEAELNRS